MAFFEDLTPYTYHHPEKESPGTVNVGWLDRRHPFSTGRTSVQFQTKLERLCQRPYKVHRGFHTCPFCGGSRSHTEIRVCGEERVYAAPRMIYHYVVIHQYRPPAEFIKAVTSGKAPKEESE